jgi:DNA topoisomerase-2
LIATKGGRHGYGAKLTNIFSKSFTIETVDAKKRLRYQQTWSDNMSKSSPPEITPIDAGIEDYTCITFVPDMARLGGDSKGITMDPQDYAVMCRRVVDAAGCAAGKLQVFLNGRDVSVDSFANYSNMYRGVDAPEMRFTNINSRWTVGIGRSEGHSFESVSFVNGMATPRGGTHVNSVVNQVVKRVQEKASKLEPDLSDTLNPSLIRRNIFVSCNALIENPTFDSQMKEYLTSNPSSFGSSYQLKERFLNQLVDSEEDGGPGIIEEVIRAARGRQQANLFKQVGGKKTRRQLLSIPKLEDAHAAGSETCSECTLILTEGDSAKALAVAGLEVIGREHYGVFPLRGKLLNVRHATVDQLSKNAEVKAMVSILGLDFDKEYDTADERNEMRYGHVMLMTDQDNDGSHIKGLVINFFRHFWPKLLKPAVDDPLAKTFLSSFATPLLKASRKKDELSFYSMADFNEWRASIDDPNELKQWKIKYYKGLGTSTPAEAKVYFSEFEKHHRPFHWGSENDGELLDKVFDKTRAADRRDWITNEYDAEATLDFGPDHDSSVAFEDFVNKEMIHFSNADNIRSLPSAIDGLKPSQRKVLYACFKRNLKSEVKVAQLSGYCAEHTAYHHGEQSLQGTSKSTMNTLRAKA